MHEIKYFLYVDILGFKGLAEEIAEKKGLDQRMVRERLIRTIKDKVEIIERKNKIVGKKYGESDDWLLVTDSCDSIFYCVSEILDHATGFDNYKQMPLEIAIGMGEFDKLARFDGTNLIIENSTIEFFKTNIINIYHQYFKEMNNQSPNSTFIVCTEETYRELEPLDRKIFSKIKYTQLPPKKQKSNFFYTANVDKIQRRGTVLKFLEKIGYEGNRWYKRIPEVYVPPIEYKDILKTLDEKKIVFITGTQEYGKTFTAIRLLWEYYNKGYEPIWHKGRSQRERDEIERRLEDIKTELKPRHIIYFEDPFGITKYEERTSLEREIGTILDIATQVRDTYIIITSREEVFKEFQKEKLSGSDLGEFENRLNIKRPSYDYEKRNQILLNWAEEQNCRWLRNASLKDFLCDYIGDERILPTPLSLRDFAIATEIIEDKYELRRKIKEKSEETSRAFADEIKNMSYDKVLFLAFFFISKYFEREVVKEIYQELTQELNLESPLEFDRILDWFLPDKINVRKIYLELAHPSYYETIDYLLIEDGYPTSINEKIIGPLLLRLAKMDIFAGDIGTFLIDNYNKLTPKIREDVLMMLSIKENAGEEVAVTIKNNFDEIPSKIRDIVIEHLCEFVGASEVLGDIIMERLPYISKNVVGDVVVKLLEHERTSEKAVRAIFMYFHEIHVNLAKGLIDKISYSDNEEVFLNFLWAAESILYDSQYFPDKVKEDLLGIILHPYDGEDVWDDTSDYSDEDIYEDDVIYEDDEIDEDEGNEGDTQLTFERIRRYLKKYLLEVGQGKEGKRMGKDGRIKDEIDEDEEDEEDEG